MQTSRKCKIRQVDRLTVFGLITLIAQNRTKKYCTQQRTKWRRDTRVTEIGKVTEGEQMMKMIQKSVTK